MAPLAAHVDNSTLKPKEPVKSGSASTFAYQCSVNPLGGNTTKGVSDTDSTKGSTSGSSRKATMRVAKP